MRSITIDILNDKAYKLLEDLELLNLIKLRNENQTQKPVFDLISKYKGTMTKQVIPEIETQLKELREGWE